jgi:hypothetical protein
MGYLVIYLYFIVTVKILFLFFALRHLYFRAMLLKYPKNKEYLEGLKRTSIYKTQVDFVFTNMMAVLLIYIFNPRQQNEKYISKETKFLMYIFGFIIIVTSDWNQFIDDSTILYLVPHHKTTKK